MFSELKFSSLASILCHRNKSRAGSAQTLFYSDRAQVLRGLKYHKVRALCAGLMLLFSGCISAQAADELKGKTLNIGMVIAPPFVCVVPGNFEDLHGIDIDLINELQQRTGFTKGKTEVTSFDELMIMGKSTKDGGTGKVDIMAGGFYILPEREQIYAHGAPTLESDLVIVSSSKDSNITGIKDLKGKKIADEVGTTTLKWLPADILPTVTINKTTSSYMAFIRVSQQQSDALITDEVIAKEFQKNWPDINIAIVDKIPDSNHQIGLLFRIDSPYTPILQKTLNQMAQDGTIERILRNYFAHHKH